MPAPDAWPESAASSASTDYMLLILAAAHALRLNAETFHYA